MDKNKKVIDSFSGKYSFLSNFYPVEVVLDGVTYPTVEHAYQAAKTDNAKQRLTIKQAITPGSAKRLGALLNLDAGWESSKVNIMRELLLQKFADVLLRHLLLETGDAILVEGNHWGDVFWGKCDEVGENKLGKLLMEIRDILRMHENNR